MVYGISVHMSRGLGGFSNVSSRERFYCISRKKNLGVRLAPEMNEYDAIFAALKHPVRRQILLFLEEKGEASFTAIQNAVGISDTGLVSYHLGELAPLVEQSARGKYRLSEIGQTSITLFRKVEQEKQRTSTAVRKELEKAAGEIVFLFLIVGVTLIAPMSTGIYVSVQNLHVSTLSSGQMAGLYLIGLSGMILGAILFAFYDRHYFSKNIKTNTVHSSIFALGISLLLALSAYVTYGFEQATRSIGPLPSKGGAGWLLIILTAIPLLASAPITTYIVGRLMKKQ
jgi:DNA-binding transcriptional ArsR family regulator